MNTILKITLLLSTLFCYSKVFATAQFGDRLIIDKDTLFIYSNPLEKFLERKAERTIAGVQLQSGCTALWRGYVATWKIENDSFFLVGVEINSCDLNPRELPIEKEFGRKRVFAKWVNGNIIHPKGELLDYIHMGYASIYESEITFSIKKGKLKKKSIKNFLEYDENLIFPGEYFLRDTLYSLILNSIDTTELNKFGGEDYSEVYIMFNENRVIEEITNLNEKPIDQLFLKAAKEALKNFPPLMKVNHERYGPPYFELFFMPKYIRKNKLKK